MQSHSQAVKLAWSYSQCRCMIWTTDQPVQRTKLFHQPKMSGISECCFQKLPIGSWIWTPWPLQDLTQYLEQFALGVSSATTARLNCKALWKRPQFAGCNHRCGWHGNMPHPDPESQNVVHVQIYASWLTNPMYSCLWSLLLWDSGSRSVLANMMITTWITQIRI